MSFNRRSGRWPHITNSKLAVAIEVGRPKPARLTPVVSAWSARSMPASSILPRIRVVDYGVLGTQLVPGSGIVRQAEPPDDFTAFVDPAGLHHIQNSGPSSAGGASGSIYQHIGIRGDRSFPEDVRQAVNEECDAHYHRYKNGGGGHHHVIHTVGPRLGHGKYSWDVAVATLAGAYRNVLARFARFAASKAEAGLAPKGTPVRLRLLPISGGIFAGEYQERIAPLTLAALQAGIGLLTEEECGVLAKDGTQIELCIFLMQELAPFHAAMAAQLAGQVPAAAAAPATGAARPKPWTQSGALKHARERQSMRQSRRASGVASRVPSSSTAEAADGGRKAAPSTTQPEDSPLGAPPTEPPPPPPTGVAAAAPAAAAVVAAVAGSDPAQAATPASGCVRLAVGVVLAAGLAIGAVVVRRARRG